MQADWPGRFGPAKFRADGFDQFMFKDGPARRFAGRLRPKRITARSSLPGGESGNIFSPFYANLLGPWLRNETHPLLTSKTAVANDAVSDQAFEPAVP